MNAQEVMAALEKRYPAEKHLLVKEAPTDHMRMGRKIDLLVINLWRSRGFERHAFEIKVSVTDFRKEIDNPEKADWWVRHCHRFSIAVPQSLADTARFALPPNWGLIVVDAGGRAKERAGAPPNPNPEALPMKTWIGITRAVVNAGPFIIERARAEGYEAGRRAALEALGVDMTPEEAQRLRREARTAQERYEALKSNVQRFEQQTGINLASWNPISDEAMTARADVFRRLQQIIGTDQSSLAAQVDRVRTHHTRIGEALGVVERLVAPPAAVPTSDSVTETPSS